MTKPEARWLVVTACVALSVGLVACSDQATKTLSSSGGAGAAGGSRDGNAGASGPGGLAGQGGSGGAAVGGGGGAAPVCGDGIAQPGQSCDGVDLGGASCATVVAPSATGDVTCTAACTLAPADCDCRLAGGGQPGAPWPMAGFCPRHWGRSPALGPATSNVRWTVATGANGLLGGIAIAADGTLYLGGLGGLYAVTPAGTLAWAAPAAKDMYGATPAIAADGTLYAATENAGLYAVNPDGTTRWTLVAAQPQAMFYSPAIGADGTIYACAGDGLYAVDPDGTQRWRYPLANGCDTAVVFGPDGTLYVDAPGDALATKLTAVKPDGTLKWRAASGLGCGDPLVDADGDVITLCGAHRAKDGKLLWSVGGGDTNPALQRDGTIIESFFGNVTAFIGVRPDGTIAWKQKNPTYGAAGVALDADDAIYTSASDGTFVKLAADGTLVWSLDGGGDPLYGPPAIGADGAVYLSSGSGIVYAIGP
jgi:outer membrane protein assembly factor BamB